MNEINLEIVKTRCTPGSPPPHRKPNLIYSTFLEYGSGGIKWWFGSAVQFHSSRHTSTEPTSKRQHHRSSTVVGDGGYVVSVASNFGRYYVQPPRLVRLAETKGVEFDPLRKEWGAYLASLWIVNSGNFDSVADDLTAWFQGFPFSAGLGSKQLIVQSFVSIFSRNATCWGGLARI